MCYIHMAGTYVWAHINTLDICHTSTFSAICYTKFVNHININFSSYFIIQRTPLHIAVEEGQGCTVKFLIDSGADVIIKDNDGVSTI